MVEGERTIRTYGDNMTKVFLTLEEAALARKELERLHWDVA